MPRPGSPVPSTPERREGLRACYWEDRASCQSGGAPALRPGAVADRLLLGNEDVSVIVAGVVCATMALTILVAKVVGCTLPMLAKRLGFDPAVMASPFITTIVDALSLLIYFGIASAVLF